MKIALVPFASSVNLGAKYRGADWLDMRGWSSVHHENIDWAGTGTNGDAWPDAVQSGVGWKSATTTTLNAGPNPPDPLPPGITNYRYHLAVALDPLRCARRRLGRLRGNAA